MRRATGAMLQVQRYLDRMALSPEERAAIEARVDIDPRSTPAQAMASLHRALAAGKAASDRADEPAYGSVAARIRLSHAAPEVRENLDGHVRLQAAPSLTRISMTPRPWGPLNPLVRWSESVLRRPR
jgi:membrane glycosyltransferase